MTYANILVPVAFDEDDEKAQAALSVAKELAGEGSTITILHVIEQMPAYVSTYIPEDVVKATREGILNELDKLAEGVPGGKAVMITGHSGRSILDWSKENENDLIVIASHRPGMQDLVFGSTAAHVVRHATCSVHVLR